MPSPLRQHDRVRIITDRFRQEGAPAGTIGYVTERRANGALGVEVPERDGTAVARLVAAEDELELAEDEEHYRVRCPDCLGEKRCDTCGGTGSWKGNVCPFCGGDGVCYHCGGKGFVTEAD